jgi:CHAT domain-containing protein/predicted negative regulator of RcsB-dependent stress response
MGQVLSLGMKQRDSGRYADAAQSFTSAARLAHVSGDKHWEAKSLVLLSGCRLRLSQYVPALQASENASVIATANGDKIISGAASGNISSIYAQLGNFTLARQKLLQAIADLRQTNRKDLLAKALYALSYQQIRFGEVQAGIRSSDLAIQAAQEANDPELEASAWDFRGVALVLTHHLDEADASLAKAISIYQRRDAKRVPSVTLEHLAELRWHQKQNLIALELIDRAFGTADASFKSVPAYYSLGVRANILKELGRTDEALTVYRKAINSANSWRRAALPGDTTNSQTVQQLSETYHGFAEFTAELSLKRRDQALAREALQVLAQNRAATLREQRARDLGKSNALPPEYLEKLGELQNVQARVTLSQDANSLDKLTQLQSEIDELENKIGLADGEKVFSSENNLDRNSLRNIQTGLGRTEALLSFCLGEQSSYLWAVTGETLNLYRLPRAAAVGNQAKNFRESLANGRNFTHSARELSGSLFSQLDPNVVNKPDWIIVGDGALLDRIPFSALPGIDGAGEPLVNKHTIRLLPSEFLLLNRQPDSEGNLFLGIADPLYNIADARRPQQLAFRNVETSRGSSALGRLPGTQREVRTSAQCSGMSKTELLLGTDANLRSVIAALEQRPSIIHFAVHVVSPPEHPEQAALALGLGENNVPELLTRERIASLRVPGSLVVLSGCSSGQGRTAPSTGLVGLSRAWLLAGASAVVVSNWPTPDDSGQFFSYFYSYLATHPSSLTSGVHCDSLAKRAASALQQAQLETQRRGRYGSAPAFWAAYSLVAKE